MKAKHFNLICKAFLSLVFVFLPISNSAQQIRSVWIYDYLDSWTIKGDSIYGRGSYSIYQSIGAIEIEGKEYTAIEIKGEDIPTSKRRRRAGKNTIYYHLAIRYDNGRILANCQDYMNYLADKYSDGVCYGDPSYIPYHQTDDGEIILYDFNMEVGDRYRHVDGYYDVYVTATDSISLTDGKHKRLILNNGLVLIEGIGCINSPGMLFDYLNPSPNVKHWICDLALYVDNVNEYGDWWSASPIYEYTNPLIADRTVGIEENVKNEKLKKERAIFNLQGQRINGLQKELNIVDGKKIMVK